MEPRKLDILYGPHGFTVALNIVISPVAGRACKAPHHRARIAIAPFDNDLSRRGPRPLCPPMGASIWKSHRKHPL